MTGSAAAMTVKHRSLEGLCLPFRFTGILKRVIVEVEGEPLFDPDLEYRIALARQ